MSDLTLAKLHATGNDFLVHLALDARDAVLDADAVTALCDRHRGIGADGLITITAGARRRRLHDDAAQRRRRARGDERQRRPLSRVGRRRAPDWREATS